MKSLRALFSVPQTARGLTIAEAIRWQTIEEEQAAYIDRIDMSADINPQPNELAADACRAEIEALRAEINRDNGEITHWTDRRDRHLNMLAAEEAKAKVLAAFPERTIEAGKMPMAAE